jgi:hypothetical protein
MILIGSGSLIRSLILPHSWRLWVSQRRGFKQLWVVHDGGGKFEPLFHARRIGLHLSVSRLAETDIIENFVGPLHGRPGGHADEFSRVSDKFDPFGSGEQAFILRCESDFSPDVQLSSPEIHAEDLPRSRIHGYKPQERADHRGFARSIRTEQSHSAGRNRDRKVVKRSDGAIGLGDCFELK